MDAETSSAVGMFTAKNSLLLTNSWVSQDGWIATRSTADRADRHHQAAVITFSAERWRLVIRPTELQQPRRIETPGDLSAKLGSSSSGLRRP
jgi:hypothetical protein